MSTFARPLLLPTSLHPHLRPLFNQPENTLPPFRQSALRLIELLANDATSAQPLSAIIMNDPGLSSRVLHVANSFAYSPTSTITSVHHAVVWLGFNNLRTIVATIKLLDDLLPSIGHSPSLMQLISQSILAASHASELGTAIQYQDLPNLYTRTLLYNMVDVMLAYQAPDLYESLLVSERLQQAPREADELRILGVTKRHYAQLLAQLWRIPADFLAPIPIGFAPLEAIPPTPWKIPTTQHLGLMLTTNFLTAEMAQAPHSTRVQTLRDLLQSGCQLLPRQTERLLTEATNKGHQLLRSSGLAAFAAGSHNPSLADDLVVSKETRAQQVIAFQEVSRHSTDINMLFTSFLKALRTTIHFQRIALALLDPRDTTRLVGRYLVGAELQTHLTPLTGSLQTDHPFFSSVLKRMAPLIVPDLLIAGRGQLSPSFATTWKPKACLLAPVRINTRPIGLLYADYGSHTASIPAPVLDLYQLFYVPLAEGLRRLAQR